MSVCLFLSFRLASPSARVDASETTGLDRLLRGTPKLLKCLVHTSARASDPYLDDGPSPHLVLQLYFAELPDLEAVLARDGYLQALGSRDAFPHLAGADVSQQAMLVRPFAVPEPAFKTAPGQPYCTYLVAYEGEAEGLNLWLDHYLARHTGHMACFPGIRELEVYTRLDWVGFLPGRRVNFMQRNKVAFDSAKALDDALHSPVRHEMRADYKAFPSFTGPNTHYAMATRVIVPDRP